MSKCMRCADINCTEEGENKGQRVDNDIEKSFAS